MPTISVIVPVYKAERFLPKCAQSILNQSFSDLELLLVEDGSPDQSGALCDYIAAGDSRVRVFHKKNGGVSSARNLGLQEARGDYIAFADADDWLEPKALQELNRIRSKARADTAGCAHYNVQPDGRRIREPAALPPGVYEPEDIRAGIVNRLLGYRLGKPGEVLNGFIWRFLFSGRIIREHRITFNGPYLEDELFLLEYFCRAKRLAMTDKPLYCYLQNPQSVTRNYLPDYMSIFRSFMEAKRALVKRHGLDLSCWEESSNWAGLLIAIGNEYAPGNPASPKEKQAHVKAYTQLPEIAWAIQTLNPTGMGRNKQVVATLVRRKWFGVLTLFYLLKNRKRQVT